MSFLGKLKKDDLLRHTAILTVAMMVVHVSNMVFQMAVGRVLPQEEYSLLAAFLGVLAIIQRPLSTLATGVGHYGNLLQQDGRTGDVKRLLRKWLLMVGGPALLCGAVAVVFNYPVARWLHLERVAPVVIAGAVLPALFVSPVLAGAVQGLQLFGWSSASSMLGALVRLALGAGLVWFWYPACGWAMVGHGMGIYVAGGILLAGLLVALRGMPKTREPLPSLRFYLLQSFFVQAAYAVLMTADVVMVKHFIPEDTEFAYAATLGRMVVFLPGAIVTAMVPKVTSRGTATRQQRSVFFKSFGITAAFVLCAVVGCCLFAGLFVQILWGISDPSAYLKRMIGLMAVVMGASALLNVVVLFLMAQRRFVPAFSTVVFALLYLAGSVFFHETTWALISIAGICNGGALLVGLMATLRIKLT